MTDWASRNAARSSIRYRGDVSSPQSSLEFGGALARKRSKQVTSRGAWRLGGLIGAVVYSLMVWGVFFQATPRLIAWLGQRQAAAASHETGANPAAPERKP